jgi:hypothetical protein
MAEVRKRHRSEGSGDPPGKVARSADKSEVSVQSESVSSLTSRIIVGPLAYNQKMIHFLDNFVSKHGINWVNDMPIINKYIIFYDLTKLLRSVTDMWGPYVHRLADTTDITTIKQLFINAVAKHTRKNTSAKHFMELFRYVVSGKGAREPLLVYRGDVKRGRAAVYYDKRRFEINNFCSTTLQEVRARGFGTVTEKDGEYGEDGEDGKDKEGDEYVFEIILPSTFPLCVLSKTEYEILLPPFITLAVDEVVVNSDEKHTRNVIKAHIEDWEYILAFKNKRTYVEKIQNYIKAKQKDTDYRSIARLLRNIVKV